MKIFQNKTKEESDEEEEIMNRKRLID